MSNANFYVHCSHRDDHLYVTKFVNGEKVFDKRPYQPHVFVATDSKKTPYRSIKGNPLQKITFRSIREARNFVYQQAKEFDGHNKRVHGNLNWQYVYMSEEWPEQEDFAELTDRINHLTVVYIDIEVSVEGGFPSPTEAMHEVTAITMKVIGPNQPEKNVIVFGCGDFKPKENHVEYRRFKNEKKLLLAFIDAWETIGPDIVTGWYIEYFDIPYLHKRMTNLFNEETANRLSPWDIVTEQNSLSEKDDEVKVRNILGVAVLDYRALYKKFRLKGQESYSLNHIAHVELKQQKLNYDQYGNLDNLRLNNFQLFIEYNIRDVELVEMLDKKLKFIQMATLLSYDAKVNFYDVFAQTRMWDTLIYRYLKERNIVLPPKPKPPDKDSELKGAFVKEPFPTEYEWVTSFDLDSMYPSMMIQWNISPDTLKDGRMDLNIDQVLRDRPDFELRDDLCLTPAGYAYRKDKRGFMPDILIRMYEDRVSAKKQAGFFKAQVAAINDELANRGYKE